MGSIMGSPVHWRCIATGRVQGVNYRARVAVAARRLGLAGSVANRPDGSVLIDVQGPEDRVEALLREIRGPRGASDARQVERVAVLVPDPSLLGFTIDREAG